MHKQEMKKTMIITAEPKHYLILKNMENSEELIGKPVRIILDKDGLIPEFEEREVEE